MDARESAAYRKFSRKIPLPRRTKELHSAKQVYREIITLKRINHVPEKKTKFIAICSAPAVVARCAKKCDSIGEARRRFSGCQTPKFYFKN
jgi:hypothetical protein